MKALSFSVYLFLTVLWWPLPQFTNVAVRLKLCSLIHSEIDMLSEGGSDGLYHRGAARRRRQALRRRQWYPKQRGIYKQGKARTEHPPQRKRNPPRWCEKYLPTFISDLKKELLRNAMIFPPHAL